MKALWTRFARLTLAGLTLLPQQHRLMSLASEVGEAKPAAAAAAGAAAAGTGVAAIERMASHSANAAREAFVLSAGEGVASVAARAGGEIGALDEMALHATKPEHWGDFSTLVQDTSLAKDLSVTQVETKWLQDPAFRSAIFKELQTSHPNELSGLASEMVESYHPIMLPVGGSRAAIQAAVDSQTIELKDASGHAVTSLHETMVAKEQFRVQAHVIFDEVFDSIPASSLKSEADLRAALQTALQKKPNGAYSFDATTGDLKLTYKTARGEITGKIDSYKIAAKVARYATVSGGGLVAQQLWTGRTKQPATHQTSGDSPTPKP